MTQQFWTKKLSEDSKGNTTVTFGSKTISYNKFDPRLYTVPCKYWEGGNCKMGEHCRFLHGETLSDDPRRPEYNEKKKSYLQGGYMAKDNQYQQISDQNEISDQFNNYSLNNKWTYYSNKARPSTNGITRIHSNDNYVYGLFNTNKNVQRDRKLFHLVTETKNQIKNEFQFTSQEKGNKKILQRYGRKPLVELVVLYSSQKNIRKYAINVRDSLLNNGVDLLINSEDTNGEVNKSEHLSLLIKKSIADFFIVIGNKNVQNQTCQIKKCGKLTEMGLREITDLIWSDWNLSFELFDRKYGFLPLKYPLSNENRFEITNNPEIFETNTNNKELSREELFEILARHTNVGDINLKIAKLTDLFSTFMIYSKVNSSIQSHTSWVVKNSILQKTKKAVDLFQQSLVLGKVKIISLKVTVVKQMKIGRDYRGEVVTLGYFPSNKKPNISIKLKKSLIEILSQAINILSQITIKIGNFESLLNKKNISQSKILFPKSEKLLKSVIDDEKSLSGTEINKETVSSLNNKDDDPIDQKKENHHVENDQKDHILDDHTNEKINENTSKYENENKKGNEKKKASIGNKKERGEIKKENDRKQSKENVLESLQNEKKEKERLEELLSKQFIEFISITNNTKLNISSSNIKRVSNKNKNYKIAQNGKLSLNNYQKDRIYQISSSPNFKLNAQKNNNNGYFSIKGENSNGNNSIHIDYTNFNKNPRLKQPISKINSLSTGNISELVQKSHNLVKHTSEGSFSSIFEK
ncbi:zinc finger ccch domain protein-related [Anaeramoeba flamelloides]|uniref:Zinc finger ccch domain protein-related n=1 Tax=Anaeramoeba flamelloides TaxID=1746091 RepID=A0AAV7ZY54_9EUKA|nr:zinc finger ccch domain protein-related [Anaeramoeba flamelloides]